MSKGQAQGQRKRQATPVSLTLAHRRRRGPPVTLTYMDVSRLSGLALITTKCSGCRCPAPTSNRKCGCCGRWPMALQCVRCGRWGRFDTDLVLTRTGAVHDHCLVPA